MHVNDLLNTDECSISNEEAIVWADLTAHALTCAAADRDALFCVDNMNLTSLAIVLSAGLRALDAEGKINK